MGLKAPSIRQNSRRREGCGHLHCECLAASLNAGLVDEIHVDVAPLLLGKGVRLFDHFGEIPIKLEKIRAIDAPGVTHLGFRVVK